MNNLQNAWFELGKCFAGINFYSYMRKYDLCLPEPQTKYPPKGKFTKDIFINLSNNLSLIEIDTSQAKDYFAKGTKDNIDEQEAAYYFWWGKDSAEIEEVLTLQEAAVLWEKDDANLRRECIKLEKGETSKFNNGEIRKSGNVWLIKKSAIIRVFGELNN